MGSHGTEKISGVNGAEESETTIEIKIKTTDSQTYTLKVDKQMPVPALKEQIASVTGVLSEQQRLICRGKVLKDDQLLSAYHVEDGHTLHMVVRQPNIPPTDHHPGIEPNSSTSHGHGNQLPPGVVIEAFNLPGQGEGAPSDISRLLSAILGPIGIPNVAPANEMDVRVIPDSLTTLSQYLGHVRSEFDAIIRDGGNSSQASDIHRTQERASSASSHLGTTPEGFSSPASLAEVLISTRQMLFDQAGECFQQLAQQLENQANAIDTSVRTSIQSSAWRTGSLLYNLGAYLLELGRTTMTLRLGQTSSEAVVNGGPAVFISASGPNPIMVQPLPFQPGASFGGIPPGSALPGSGLVSGLGSGFLPRRIDIQIRRGPSTTTTNVTQEERGDPSVQRSPDVNSTQATSRVSEGSSLSEDSVRIIPLRTTMVAVPGTFYPPVLRTLQPIFGRGSGEHGFQPSTQNHSSGFQTEQQPVSESQDEDSSRNGTLQTTIVRHEPPNQRAVSINILTAGAGHNSQEPERQIPSSVLQLLRSLFPGGEFHVEDPHSHGTTTDSISEQAGTSIGVAHGQEAEPRASDEGIFLSNVLHEIMPIISQAGGETNAPLEVGNSSNQDGTDFDTSRRDSDCEPNPPSAKRQKRE